jgi:predicted RNA binding protein YcfA (HicA-like mRNA interferase family)
MAKLPQVSGKDLAKFLQKQGFEIVRQKGSHVSLRKQTPEGVLQTVIPLHKSLAVGTLSNILRQCRITRRDFEEKFGK